MSSRTTRPSRRSATDGRWRSARFGRKTGKGCWPPSAAPASARCYRRFFGPKRHFTDTEIDFFLNVDFTDHVALVAVADEGGERVIAGGGRYIVTQPGQAEVAFAVVDRFQGQGVGAALMRHLVGIARRSWAHATDGGGPAGQRPHAEAVREVRVGAETEARGAGGAHHSADTRGRIVMTWHLLTWLGRPRAGIAVPGSGMARLGLGGRQHLPRR